MKYYHYRKQMKKSWIYRLMTAIAISGYLLVAIIIIDTIFNEGKLIIKAIGG